MVMKIERGGGGVSFCFGDKTSELWKLKLIIKVFSSTKQMN